MKDGIFNKNNPSLNLLHKSDPEFSQKGKYSPAPCLKLSGCIVIESIQEKNNPLYWASRSTYWSSLTVFANSFCQIFKVKGLVIQINSQLLTSNSE